MLDVRELDAAIAELEARPPSLGACAKLADLYAVRDHIKGRRETQPPAYSQAAPPEAKAGLYGDTDFLKAVAGKDAARAWLVIDELMDTLRIANARVYDSFMQKIKRI